MLRSILIPSIGLMLFSSLGCSGGTAVEEQERFQSSTPAEVNISNVIRNMVADIKSAAEAEGGASLAPTTQGVAESYEGSFDASLLSPEDQEKAKQIGELIKDVDQQLQNGAKRAQVQEKIQQMEDLANQLPKEAGEPASKGA